jgi:hypothetical protein
MSSGIAAVELYRQMSKDACREKASGNYTSLDADKKKIALVAASRAERPKPFQRMHSKKGTEDTWNHSLLN